MAHMEKYEFVEKEKYLCEKILLYVHLRTA